MAGKRKIWRERERIWREAKIRLRIAFVSMMLCACHSIRSVCQHHRHTTDRHNRHLQHTLNIIATCTTHYLPTWDRVDRIHDDGNGANGNEGLDALHRRWTLHDSGSIGLVIVFSDGKAWNFFGWFVTTGCILVSVSVRHRMHVPDNRLR